MKVLTLLILVSACSAKPRFARWDEDYAATKKALLLEYGQHTKEPTITFLNLVHFRGLLQNHTGAEPADVEELVTMAEFDTKNCNRDRFLTLEGLLKRYSDEKFGNLKLYVEFVKDRMTSICSSAFEQALLPFEENI